MHGLALSELDDSGYEIVVVCFRDFAAIEFAGDGIESVRNIRDVKLAVNFRRVHGGAAFEQHVGFLGWTFE